MKQGIFHKGLAAVRNKLETVQRNRALDAMVRGVDQERFEGLRRSHERSSDNPRCIRYLDLRHSLNRMLCAAYRLGLHRCRRIRILDIGTGAGYFPYVCKQLGHEAVSIDLDDSPMMNDFRHFFGIENTVHAIERYAPFCDLGMRFDLVCAFSVCFNGHNTDSVWEAGEWSFFINDLRERSLAPRARLFMMLNTEPEGWVMTEEVRTYFQAHGAELDGNVVDIRDVDRFVA